MRLKMLYICKFGVNTKNIHTIKQAYNIQTYKPSTEKEIFDFFIHSYIHYRVLRQKIKIGDFSLRIMCQFYKSFFYFFLFLELTKMRDNHKMYGRSSPHKQNTSRLKEEIQVSIQRLLPLLVYPLLCGCLGNYNVL